MLNKGALPKHRIPIQHNSFSTDVMLRQEFSTPHLIMVTLWEVTYVAPFSVYVTEVHLNVLDYGNFTGFSCLWPAPALMSLSVLQCSFLYSLVVFLYLTSEICIPDVDTV